ncbi:quinoprotein dehydrogenase-associated SoxYZ-like carrier [Algicella marina]|uniref:Quinoprotein dehydrogenase-associated SoxYZ-like carrier n=1 Tax=Algicella marina TaxID=2683284 RepID=A0A6P1T428_9RHOB|nr:quinoprotein dehydrogenase-associated SoxYZ-like carrier [Algicella marina]QHQ36505.1 quinoprotein dehydrogenase-associated SoxYZ-like carrier [Algicella marina]
MKSLLAASLLALMAQSALAADTTVRNPLTDEGSWEYLREEMIGDAVAQDGAAVFEVEAPYRAHDAATVPVTIHQTGDVPINNFKVIVDENPAPMAGHFTVGEAMLPLDFELRVRVDMYSNLRVVAETPDGVFMDGRFVKASGGCSAPATKDAALALASMGQMKLRQFGDAPMASGQKREAQIMIRHPNYSGMQRDQITQLFMEAHFISDLEVYQGDDLLFTMEGGISISENPVFRFTYTDNGAPTLRIRAEDTEGNVFEQELAKDART